MNQQTTDIQYILLSMLLTSFFSITATAKKVDVKNGCIVVIDKSAEGKNSHEGFGIVIDTVNSSSINYDILTSSIIELCPNFTKDDANVPSNLCQSVRNIGEYASNQADYSLEMTYDDMYRVIGKSQHLSQSRVQFDGTLSSGYDLTYTYGQDTGKRFQMSTVIDVNYRTDSVYASADDMVETHYYEYDKNGNIIHALTAETLADGTTVNLKSEEKFRWDEENRLQAISQNGYVTQYWYDADGERVVKEHGANQAVFVNSEQNAVFTQTDKFAVYPNPYFSYSDDGRYTKHIYIGAERIASQVGGKPYPSPNTESVSVAGRSNGIDIRVDYSGKLDQHIAQIDSVYDAFDLPYNGTNHDSYYDNYFFDRPGYWDNTEGMALNGGEPEMPRGIQDRDLLYYYHRDHLGSSTAVSNDDGKLSQQIEYLPYGEVFLEKRSTDQNVNYFTPYKFNGKELDEETGLYYYGARYMNPRLSIWYGTDPMQEKSSNSSSYAYCKNNPVRFIDPTGTDEWDIDEKGVIKSHKKTKEHDAFYIVNETGERLNDKSLVFKYGTVHQKSPKIPIKKRKERDHYDLYTVKGDQNGTKLFEFFSENISKESMIEFSLAQTGKTGEKGLNFITTSHERGREQGMTYLFIDQLQNGYNLRSIGHTHPVGDDFDDKDKGFITTINNYYEAIKKKLPKHFIYHVPSKKYIYYK